MLILRGSEGTEEDGADCMHEDAEGDKGPDGGGEGFEREPGVLRVVYTKRGFSGNHVVGLVGEGG